MIPAYVGSLPAGVRVFLACGRTDMRKGMNGLVMQVQTVLEKDPFSGHVFCFRGRRGDLIKALYWDTQGLCLFAKRLEKGRFLWPSPADGVVRLTAAQLSMLLEGLTGERRCGPGDRKWRAEARPIDSGRSATLIGAGAVIKFGMPVDNLPDDPAVLRRMLIAEREALAAQAVELAAAKAGLVSKTLEIEKLKVQLARLRRQQFGRSSEKIDRIIEQL